MPGRYFLTTLAVTLGLLMGLAWGYTARFPDAYLDPQYGVWKGKYDLARTRPPQSVCVLGDSCVMTDLIPLRIGARVLNFGLGGTSPIEGYFMAKRLLAGTAPLQAIVISYQPLNFDKFLADSTIWGSVKFGLIDASDLDAIRAESRALCDPSIFKSRSPFDIDARLKDWLIIHRFPSYVFQELIASRIAGWRHENPAGFRKTIETRGYYPFPFWRMAWQPSELHRRLSDFASLPETNLTGANATIATFSPPPILDFYFRRTLELFQKQRVPVYFVGMPINEVSLRAISPKVLEDFKSYLDDCATSYPGFHVLGDPVTSLPLAYYHDVMHLNFEGAAIESETVRRLLTEAIVNCGPANPQWEPMP